MKTTAVLLVIVVAALSGMPSPARAQIRKLNGSEPGRTESRELQVASIEQMYFDAGAANLTFSVAGVEYRYHPRSNSSAEAPDVSACLQVMQELRKCKKFWVYFTVQPPDRPADRKFIELDELRLLIKPE